MLGYMKISRCLVQSLKPAGRYIKLVTLGPPIRNNTRVFSSDGNSHKFSHRPIPRCGPCKIRTIPACSPELRKIFPSQLDKPKLKPCPEPPEPCPPPQRKYWLWFLMMAIIGGALYYNRRKKVEQVADKCDEIKNPKKPADQPDPVPKHGGDFPEAVPYLLIGGGTASFSAFRAIKSSCPTAKVLVISDEHGYPYMRPPLSKEMWFGADASNANTLNFKQWNGTERSLFFEPPDFYTNIRDLMKSDNGGVAVARGWSVVKLDVPKKTAILNDGTQIRFEKCLIATGSLPKTLDVLDQSKESIRKHVSVFRGIDDFKSLIQIVDCANSIAIVGGGFLGSELACALARRAKDLDTNLKVSQIFKEDGIMGKTLPHYLSKWSSDQVQKMGVILYPGAEVEDAMSQKGSVVLLLNNGERVAADHVVVAIGSEPNTKLAATSNLEVHPEHGGFIVNAELEARSNVYVAGDASCFFDTKLGRRRVEHHDFAVVSGRLAGENMTGAEKPFFHQSMYWSDLGPEIGYEAIGIIDANLPTVGVFAKATENDTPKAAVTGSNEAVRSEAEAKVVPKNVEKEFDPKDYLPKDGQTEEDYGKGVIFYLRDDIVVGIVLWNVFNRMQIARQIICEQRKYDDLNEVAKLFKIHEE